MSIAQLYTCILCIILYFNATTIYIGGLLVCLPKSSAEAFCEEMKVRIIFLKCLVSYACTVGVKKVSIYRPYNRTGNPVPFPFNFSAVAVQSPSVFNPFYRQPIRSINQVNGQGSACN